MDKPSVEQLNHMWAPLSLTVETQVSDERIESVIDEFEDDDES